MSERIWGIRSYPRYEPSRYIPIGTGYEVQAWDKNNENEIAGEPLTWAEVEAFLKLLRSANNDSE